MPKLPATPRAAIICLLLFSFAPIALSRVAHAADLEDKPDRAKQPSTKSKAAMIKAIAALEQRIAELEKRVKQLEANKTANPFGDMTEVDKRIALKLRDPLPVNFESNKLVHVIDYYRNTTGLNVFVDWKALKAAGIEEDMPITLNLGKQTPAADSLRLTLKRASVKDGEHTATFQIHRGTVLISTIKGMKQLANAPVAP